MKMKTTEELKTIPFEMYARVLDRAVKAEAERDAMRPPLSDLINLVEAIVNNDPDDLVADCGMTVLDNVRASAVWRLKRARAALAPSPAGQEERHEMTSIGDKEPDADPTGREG